MRRQYELDDNGNTMKIRDKLSEVFDVTTVQSRPVTVIEDRPKDDTLDDDYSVSRRNLHSLLEQGQEALFHALEVAKQSEHPRAFEVVGNLMKQLADINHQLLDLHSKKQKIESPKGEQSNVTNNAIFVGNTTELSRMLENLKRGT